MFSKFVTRGIDPIYDKGKKGQYVVLYGFDPKEFPIVKDHPDKSMVDNYPQPYMFQIFSIGYNADIEKKMYILKDQEGNMVYTESVDSMECAYLYDVQEFLNTVINNST